MAVAGGFVLATAAAGRRTAAARGGELDPAPGHRLVRAGRPGRAAALAVIGQAVARQAATERADHPALSAVGVRPRQLVAAALIRAALIGAAGAIGAVLAAVLASPLTPVGEARIAAASPGRMSFDPWAFPLGGVALVAAVTAPSVWWRCVTPGCCAPARRGRRRRWPWP